jgi:hypothetical protein
VITTPLTELQQMRKNLSSYQGNHDFHLRLAKIYYDRSVSSSVALNLEHQVKVTNIIDWQSYQSAIKHSHTSYSLKPTIDSALLLLNSFELVGHYGTVANFIFQEKLMEKFPNEKLTIASVLLHCLAKKGLLLHAAQLLYEFSPDHFDKAQQKVSSTEESPEINFKRLVRADNPTSFKKGQTEAGFLETCEELLDDYHQERNAQDHFATNMSWEYKYCFEAALGLHKQGLMRLAMQMYALAFALKPSEDTAEFYAGVALHRMGEHEASFQKMNQLIDKDPRNPWAYIIAGHSCAVINDMDGLESILKKAAVSKLKMPLLDFLNGFYYESRGQAQKALRLYEEGAKETDVEMFSNIYKFHIERIRHEQ